MRKQGKYEEALLMLEKLLQLETGSFGALHPETLETRKDIAWTLIELRRYDDAQKILYQVLKTEQDRLLPKDPNLLRTKMLMCDILSCQQQHETAVSKLTGVVEDFQEIL
ncbi:unnamed protein product, partial [Allacma fusca]